jgi:hypothetical protein
MIAVIGVLAALNACLTGVVALILLAARAPMRSCLFALALAATNIGMVVVIASGAIQ